MNPHISDVRMVIEFIVDHYPVPAHKVADWREAANACIAMNWTTHDSEFNLIPTGRGVEVVNNMRRKQQ